MRPFDTSSIVGDPPGIKFVAYHARECLLWHRATAAGCKAHCSGEPKRRFVIGLSDQLKSLANKRCPFWVGDYCFAFLLVFLTDCFNPLNTTSLEAIVQ